MSEAMWIVIGIVIIWAIMKRKSERRKNLKTCTIILFLVSLSVMSNAKAQDSNQCKYGSIFITAYDKYEIRTYGMNAVDYLSKPVNPERLRVAIERGGEHRNANYENKK